MVFGSVCVHNRNIIGEHNFVEDILGGGYQKCKGVIFRKIVIINSIKKNIF